MAEEFNGGGSQPAGGGKKEMSMEMRLLLAFGLMGLVMFGTQYLMPKSAKPPEPPKQTQAAPVPAAPAPKPAAEGKGKEAPEKVAADKAADKVAADKEQRSVIDTDLYHLEFSNRGAVVHSWVLKKYNNGDGKPVELVSATAAPVSGWPFSYVFPRQQPSANLNEALFEVKQDGPLSVAFEYSDGKTVARKTFHFEAKSYRALMKSEVSVAGQGLDHQLAWRGGFGDRTVHNAPDTQHSVRWDASSSKLVVESSGAASKGPVTVNGSFDFAGVEDAFFAGVAMPAPGMTTEFVTWQDNVVPLAGAEQKPHVGMSFGGHGTNEAILFVGPKDTSILRATDRKLESLIDWGWFWFIAKPLFLALHWVNDTITSNWGWAIVLATVVINLLMLPLRYSQLRSSQKMAVLQPEIQAINERYKGLSMKDPRKQKQNEEMMALYSKHGINPLGGCLPLLLQMPFFIAYYKVLSVAIELRGAEWLWVTDLSQPETLAIRLLPVGMLVTQVLMQKLTPAASPDPSQQRMMMIMMPIMLTVMFYGASSGLVLYWLTGNVVGILQQYAFNQLGKKPAPAQIATAKKK